MNACYTCRWPAAWKAQASRTMCSAAPPLWVCCKNSGLKARRLLLPWCVSVHSLQAFKPSHAVELQKCGDSGACSCVECYLLRHQQTKQGVPRNEWWYPFRSASLPSLSRKADSCLSRLIRPVSPTLTSLSSIMSPHSLLARFLLLALVCSTCPLCCRAHAPSRGREIWTRSCYILLTT